MFLFADRIDAGRKLAGKLSSYANREDTIILGLPRGGVPVAFEIAQRLHAPLDILIVRKIGVPDQEELAMGAIASGGIRVFNTDVIRLLAIPPEAIDAVIAEQEQELIRREQRYRGQRPPPDINNKIVILVDDGLATGATMRAAAQAVRQQNAKKIIVAVPVSSYDTYIDFKHYVDEIICLKTPEPFYSISQWYQHFNQTTDDEVTELLIQAEKLYGK